jgi:chromosome partitioning protein
MSKIILITHQKGGVGKSTITFNLAQNISETAKVAILDFDLQGSLSQIKSLTNVDIITFQDKIETIQNLDYDFIFIDTPPYLSNQLPELIKMSDLIIVPTKAGVLDLLAIKSTLELITHEHKKENTLIVFNMIKPNTTLTSDIYNGLEEYNIKIAKTKISDLVAFTRSVLLNGVSSDNKAQKQIDGLTKEVLTALI